MNQILISNSDILVSRISFGTGSLHHLYWKNDRQNILHNAVNNGITHFDTAPYYGYGLAEKDLGLFFKKNRFKYTITTKIGLYPFLFQSSNSFNLRFRKLSGFVFPILSLPLVNTTLKKAKKSLFQSLKNLKTDYIDFLMLHEPNINLYNTDEFIKWLDDEITKGTIRTFGISGIHQNLAPFLENHNPLSKIIQTKDSINLCQADFLKKYNHPLQFTYGYISSYNNIDIDLTKIIFTALERNKFGSLIFTSNDKERFNNLVKIANTFSKNL
jgi:aryl-alcohol dehydrogenase-like predicted oxidoreductase